MYPEQASVRAVHAGVPGPQLSGSATACRGGAAGRSRTRSSWTGAAARPLYRSAVSGSHPPLPDDCALKTIVTCIGFE